MKKTLLTLACLVMFAFGTFAQNEKYIKAMADNMTAMQNTKNPQDWQAVASKFEQINQVAKTEWLPAYWASYTYMIMSFSEKTLDKKDLFIAQAENNFQKMEALKIENDETYILKAYIAQAKLVADPQTRWQKEGANFEKNLAIATKLNPENPRVYLLQGQNVLHTPEAFGGGKGKALPILKKSKEKFETFKPTSELHPNWGKGQLDKILKDAE